MRRGTVLGCVVVVAAGPALASCGSSLESGADGGGPEGGRDGTIVEAGGRDAGGDRGMPGMDAPATDTGPDVADGARDGGSDAPGDVAPDVPADVTEEPDAGACAPQT